MYNKAIDPKYFNDISNGFFPGLLGINITHIEDGEMIGEMAIKKEFFAPNGFLHAGSIVTFADSLAGYACVAHLPENAKSFTTLELKTNFIGSARAGKLVGKCNVEHMGRTTQVWKVVVRDFESQKKVALFSCTQLILY